MNRIFQLSLLSIILSLSATGQGLEPWTKNPWYWSYQGMPVLLVGGSDDDNLFQWPNAQLIAQLDRLAEVGGNVIRNTMSDRHDKEFELYPFRQLDSGKYDLSQWNNEYWNRFEFMLRETAKRQIFVQIEVWDRFDYTDNRGKNHWQKHPYHPKNNINYSLQESGFADAYPDHPGANKQAFFFTTPSQRNNQVVLPFQEAYVNKLLDHSLKYDHVLYCMDNETKAEPAWGEHWARLIRKRAAAEGKKVYVTEMWDAWDLTSKEHRQTFDHPELYDFVDVSQNNHNSGKKHWDNFLHVQTYLSSQPRPINTTKTYGADGNKFGHSDQDAIERFWRHLLAGAASARFHRPDSGLGLSDKARNCIRVARLVEQSVRFWELEPALGLIQEKDGEQAYLSVSPSEGTGVAFLPLGTSRVKFTLRKTANANRNVSWINITDARRINQRLNTKASLELQAPYDSNWIAVITPSSTP